MKKVFLIIGVILLIILGALFGIRTYTKSFSPSNKLAFNDAGVEGSLIYCKPFKKDREIFGKLVPYEEVWRTGANEATEITFKSDVKFGGELVKAGIYTLFVIPNPDNWTVILNTELEQWGAFNYKKELDKLRVEVPVEQISGKAVEQFTIRFEPAPSHLDLIFEWDQTRVKVPIMKP
jgi:hypothetical protein